MNDYDVKKALSKRSGQSNNAPGASQSINGIPNSVLADVFAGKRSATSDMMGHREELAPSIAAKMSQSFGMDFSAVKVYRSDAMAGTEMHGMAQGDRVVLSSDVDLNTMEGQATLGHELSHIRAQSMGMGSGRGLLNDASLEHQADSEGMLAARGMNISGETMGMSMGLGMAGVENLSPVGAGLGASAAAPMQASKNAAQAAEAPVPVQATAPVQEEPAVPEEDKELYNICSKETLEIQNDAERIMRTKAMVQIIKSEFSSFIPIIGKDKRANHVLNEVHRRSAFAVSKMKSNS